MDLSSRVYVKNYVNLAIIPEKTVEVHIIKQKKLSGDEREVNILEYEVSNWDKLQQQVQDCFELVKEIRNYISYFGYSSKRLLGFDKNLTTDINYMINISCFYIEMLYEAVDVNTIKFLETTNLNQRYDQIKESLAKLLIIKHKQYVEEIVSKAHESTIEVNKILKGYSVIIFDKEIAKLLPLSNSYKELILDIRMFDSYILTTEQIIQNHYKGEQTILLIKEDSEKHNPNKNTIPSIKAKVINTVRLEDNTAYYIRIIPESRVQVTEIVLKDGVFYGKAEEIEELAVSNEIDSNDAVSNTPTTITEWRELGKSQVESNESEKALQSFNKALEIDPNDQTVLACKVAVLIYGLKQYQAVIDLYNQHPCIPDILPICSGDAYYGLEKYDEAINYYSKRHRQVKRDVN